MKVPVHLDLCVANCVGYANLIINILASTIMFYHKLSSLPESDPDSPARFDTPMTPAGWAFSIWGLIFTMQGAAVVAALVSREQTRQAVELIGYGWFVAWLAEGVWQYVFAQRTVQGMWVCFGLVLLSLAASFYSLLRLDVYKPTYFSMDKVFVPPQQPVAMWVAFLFRASTAMCAAWLTLAACLGFLVGLRAMGVPYVALVPTSAIMTGAVTVVGCSRVYYKGDAVYAGTVVWILSGIVLRAGVTVPVKATAIICLGIIGVVIGVFSAESSTQRILAEAEDDVEMSVSAIISDHGHRAE